MGRPIYNYELTDPDFSWLISNFKENNPSYTLIESSGLPIVFISCSRSLQIEESERDANDSLPLQPSGGPADEQEMKINSGE